MTYISQCADILQLQQCESFEQTLADLARLGDCWLINKDLIIIIKGDLIKAFDPLDDK